MTEMYEEGLEEGYNSLDSEGLTGIAINPESYTVMFYLEGDRMKDPTKVLDKMYSGYDNPLLSSAINDLIMFYHDYIKESGD